MKEACFFFHERPLSLNTCSSGLWDFCKSCFICCLFYVVILYGCYFGSFSLDLNGTSW